MKTLGLRERPKTVPPEVGGGRFSARNKREVTQMQGQRRRQKVTETETETENDRDRETETRTTATRTGSIKTPSRTHRSSFTS